MKKKDAVIEIKKKKQVLYPYCKTCGKSVKPKRIIENPLYYHIWIIASLASLGILFPFFLIYHFHVKKKQFCGYCHNKLKFYDSLNKFPGSKAQLKRIIEQINEEKVVLRTCPYCHEKFNSKLSACPFCKVSSHEE